MSWKETEKDNSLRFANLWHAAFAPVPIFFHSFAPPASLYCEEHVCIYTYLTSYRLCMYYRCYLITLRVKHFDTNRETCEVLAGYLSLWCRTGDDWANRETGQNVLQSSCGIGISTSSSSFHIFFLTASFEETFIINIT
jgi:hypothetical protein